MHTARLLQQVLAELAARRHNVRPAESPTTLAALPPTSFALHLPHNLPMDVAAPLLCAGRWISVGLHLRDYLECLRRAMPPASARTVAFQSCMILATLPPGFALGPPGPAGITTYSPLRHFGLVRGRAMQGLAVLSAAALAAASSPRHPQQC